MSQILKTLLLVLSYVLAIFLIKCHLVDTRRYRTGSVHLSKVKKQPVDACFICAGTNSAAALRF